MMEFDLKRTFRSVQEAVKKLDKAMENGIEESRQIDARSRESERQRQRD